MNGSMCSFEVNAFNPRPTLRTTSNHHSRDAFYVCSLVLGLDECISKIVRRTYSTCLQYSIIMMQTIVG